jgi:two-component system cell cycle sensor histidine kinase/response regulator CckA
MARILIVDDDEDVLEMLGHMVGAFGHEVLTARSGVEALDILDDTPSLDLLLTDVVMPGLNGFNLAHMARLRRASLRVLYLTGYHEQALAVLDKGIKYGKTLRKPIAVDDLRRELGDALVAKERGPTPLQA